MAERFKRAEEIIEEVADDIPAPVLGASGGVQYDRADHNDLTHIPPSVAQKLGIAEKLAEGWTPAWDNAPQASERAFGFDSLVNAEDKGSIVVKRPGTDQPFTRFDVALILIPPAVNEAYQAAEAKRTQDYIGMSEQDRWPGQRRLRDLQRGGEEATKQQSHQNRAAGIVDPVHGMSLEEGLNKSTAQEREEVAARYRRGARHVSMSERQAEAADRHREAARAAQTGKRSFAMGAGLDKSGRIVR